MHVALRPRSGVLLLCVFVSGFILLLQNLWVPPEMMRNEPGGRSPEDNGQRNLALRRLALRVEALSIQVQRLSRQRDVSVSQRSSSDLSLFLQSLREEQQVLSVLVEKKLRRVSQRMDQISLHHLHHHHHHQTEGTPWTELQSTKEDNKAAEHDSETCNVPLDPEFPMCAEKVEFLRARWRSDPCYGFYGVDGSTCSILIYLSQIEDFCPPKHGGNQSDLPWHPKPPLNTQKAEVRETLTSLYKVINNNNNNNDTVAVKFIRSRVERTSHRWIRAALMMKRNPNRTDTPQMKVLLYPGALAGTVGQRFQAMLEQGGPLGELVQWADLSACLTVLGHNLTFSISQSHLHRLIGAAPGRGSCPVQRPLTFDLIYTDYHGLAHLRGAMGLAFQRYQCRFRVLDSFGTEPAFNLPAYAQRHGFNTQWGSWALQPQQYMTMFPHTPDNSFLGFVSEEINTERGRMEKDRIAVVYGKQDYMWQGKSEYVKVISEEIETHATVYQFPGRRANLPLFVKNHGLLSQQRFLQLLHKAKVFVGLGFPYEGPAPIEAIALGCVFLQPRFEPPHSSDNTEFYRGKPTSRQITSQHPYAADFIGKPHVWSVDVTNKTEIHLVLKDILNSEVKPFTPHEFTCVGMLERVHDYITHQSFCSNSAPTWPSETVLRTHLGPLGQSCVSVCRRSSLVCEPALFHLLNMPEAFIRLGLGCSTTEEEVNHLFPSYTPWGRYCGLQKEPLLFSCAGSDPSHRRLCPCT